MSTNRDLKTVAHSIIREKLINCELVPGAMINEAQLCSELNISRTPVREALSRLESEGFIKIISKKGIYVTDVTLNDVMQIFQARMEVEPVALRIAGPRLPRIELEEFRSKFADKEPDIKNAFRLDTAMHLFIVEHCGNRFIIDMMHKVFAENTRVIISSKQNEVNIHDARKEHLEILELLINQEYEKAASSMQNHIKNCRQAALEHFYSIQNYSYGPTSVYKDELRKIK